MNRLLDHCGHCPEDDPRSKRHEIGTKIEKEHTHSSREASSIATTHEKENPLYYPDKPKPKTAKEALRWMK